MDTTPDDTEHSHIDANILLQVRSNNRQNILERKSKSHQQVQIQIKGLGDRICENFNTTTGWKIQAANNIRCY